MRTLIHFLMTLIRSLFALFRSRQEQAIVELALRQQLSVDAHQYRRPRHPGELRHDLALPPERWVTFLRHHKEGIAGMDFFLVPTVYFRLLYVWFAIDQAARRSDAHGRMERLNASSEGFGGSSLEHMVVLGGDHLRRLLREYIEYYNTERVHTSLDDAPIGRASDARPSERARFVGLPRVGELHHRYVWREAA